MNIYEVVLRQISKSNKYLDCYCNLIDRAAARASSKVVAKSLLGYVETHHVIPRSFKIEGTNNLVHLTAKEHILAHKLLIKFSIGDRLTAALRAYHCMCFKNNGGKNSRSPTLHQLADARKANSLSNRGPRGMRGPPSWSKCYTIEEFKSAIESRVNSGMSDPAIGREFNVSATAVCMWKKKLGISNRREQLRNRELLQDLYVTQCLSAGEISRLIGCTANAVQQYLKRYDIPVRTAIARQSNIRLPLDKRFRETIPRTPQ